jgi:hypothetical protein
VRGRVLQMLTTVFLVLALFASQVSWTPINAFEGRGSDEPIYVAHDGHRDAVLSGERDRTGPTIVWRTSLPERPPLELARLAPSRGRNAGAFCVERPERRAVRLHRPRMFAGDDRPPRAMTNV